MTLKRALEQSVKSDTKSAGIADSVTKSMDEHKPEHILLGEAGEKMAAEYLSEEGYRIIGKNVRYPWGEIDIIARDRDELVFVEVRTRSVGKLLPPECTVGPDKIKKLIRAARTWTEGKQYEGFWRIDLVAITLNEGRKPIIEHIAGITEGVK